MHKSETKPPDTKVFLCYAQENDKLFTDFVNKFNNHNGDTFELWHDNTPYTGNMHERFQKFARECHIALLLVSPKFTLSSSYASKHELPILLERQKSREVAIVGVRFMDGNYEEWNEDGEVYFFQVKNGEINSSSRKDAKNEYAVYEKIRNKDRNSFHKNLKTWVMMAYQGLKREKTTNGSIQEKSVVEKEIEDFNWQTMLNPDFHHLEQKLRDMEETYFSKNGFPKPSVNSMYLQAYIDRSKIVLEKSENSLRNCNPENYHFVEQVITLYKKPMEICTQLHQLLSPVLPSTSRLYWELDSLCSKFEETENQIFSTNLKSHTSANKQLQNDYLIPLADAIDDLCGELNKFIMSAQN